ncbi:MAG: sugar phosphate isomerase/epimerase [Candidatus Aenigmarchaeota archaeon]|nr:sugar phosphate isomerase/epimerase [Candidatus Aenigmarchaeota archaeon]
MKLKLGINTGFAVNRFPEPEEWSRIVGDLGLRHVQFTADMLNAALPDEIVNDHISRINECSRANGFAIETTFTGAFTRVNHLSHPDESLRKYWISWFKRYAEISRRLGAESMGSHFGIMSVRDLKERKDEMLQRNIDGWKEISVHAKATGLKYLTWEPMSIPREYGESIEETRKIHSIVNRHTAIPMKLCLDVDHGDVSSKNPRDTDPYEWLMEFAKEAPIIHIKQSLKDKGGHWPFIHEKNKDGKIIPEKILQALEDAGVKETTLLLELSFREREPFESTILNDLKASVDFWRPYVPD